MRHPSPLLRIVTVGVAVTALVCGLSATQTFAAAHSAASVSPGAPAAPGATPAGVDSGQNAGGQSSSHAYRHGAFPTLSAQRAAPAVPAAPTPNMYFHGATNGVGVTTGAPKVYLIFWGNQWGNAGVDADGYTTFSNDASGEAHISQALMRGLGTGNDSWSGVMTQYCQGIPAGTADCSASHEHIGYPTGGALAGVWYDNAAATPVSATANQLATEAIRAAGHFGNTTAASNRNNQYVILSPTGTTPDRFNAGADFCACTTTPATRH